MNKEIVGPDNGGYSLYAIPWDELQCGDVMNFSQNIILKPGAPENVQLIHGGDLLIQPTVDYDVQSKQQCNNKVDSANEENSGRPLGKSSQSQVRYLRCKAAEARLPRKRKKEADRTIKCHLCETTFTRVSQYRVHMRQHRNAKKYKCDQCAESYNVEANYKVHMAMHAKGEPQCPICDRKFQRLASLKSHLMMHKVDETFSCQECWAEYDKESDLFEHMETHQKEIMEIKSSDIPYICSYCNYLFQDPDKYKEHVILHIKTKRILDPNKKSKRRNASSNQEYAYKCDHCSKSFPKMCRLDRHRRTHTGEKPFVCKICNRGFSQNGTLQIHLNKHKGKRPFECVFCNAKFTQKGNLRVHLEKTHTASAPGEKVYKCIHCPCIFKKVSSLNGHITKTHSDSMKGDSVDIASVMDQLKELGKQSAGLLGKKDVVETNVSRVEEPVVETGGDDSYVRLADCSIDGSVRRYLIKQRMYGDSRWYICSYCTKEFKKPSDLIRHIRIHTREKPFKCKECGQTFSHKSSLRNHFSTHDRQDFSCVICLKKFTYLRTLNVHLRKHDKAVVAHKTRCFKCSVCDKTFVTIEEAKEHMIIHDTPDTVVITKNSSKVDVNIVMREPLVETESGLFSLPAPVPKIPYATLEQFKNRPFKCHVCDAAFLKSMHLKRHMLTHSGTKDFECEICAKTFFTNYALKEHMNYHTKTKNHECKICKKKFYTNSILKRHLLMHSSQNPYICPYCKMRFKQAQFCRKHIRTTHKRDLNESLVAISETCEMNLGTKILDLADALITDVEYPDLNVADGNVAVGALKPIEIYNNISTVDNRILPKEESSGRRRLRKRRVVQQIAEEVDTNENDTIEDAANVEIVQPEVNVQQDPVSLSEVTIGNLQDNVINYPTIYISPEDLQLLSNSNVVNSLLPQLKIQNTDPLLLSSINELQDSNILYPLDPLAQDETEFQEVQNYNTFNPGLIFSSSITDLNLNLEKPDLEKQTFTNEQIDLELNQIATQKVDSTINDNLIILNDVQKTADLTYFNINFSQSDYIDINSLNLGPNVSIGKVMQPCEICKQPDAKPHICHDKGPEYAQKSGAQVEEKEKEEEATEFNCNYCDKSFQFKSAMLRHVSTKHKETVDNNCTFCTKVFKKRSDLIRHLRTHTGEKPFSCDKCDKSFSLKSTLNSHLRTHDPLITKDFQCQVCDTYFSCKSSLKTHMSIHSDIKRFSCELCSMKFRNMQHKKSHMQSHEKQARSNAPPKVNKLNLLESILLDADAQNLNQGDNVINSMLIYDQERDPLNQELQQATQNLIANELPIADNLNLTESMEPILLQLPPNYASLGLHLEIDGQIINMKQSLDDVIHDTIIQDSDIQISHIREPHLQDLPVPQIGDSCIQDVIQDSDILQDAVLQEEVAPREKNKKKKVQCDICLKFYASKSILNKHKKWLHGDFKCTKCPKAFDSKDLLDKHTRLHFGYRPYPCSLCANSFSEESSLKIHLRRIHQVIDKVNTLQCV